MKTFLVTVCLILTLMLSNIMVSCNENQRTAQYQNSVAIVDSLKPTKLQGRN